MIPDFPWEPLNLAPSIPQVKKSELDWKRKDSHNTAEQELVNVHCRDVHVHSVREQGLAERRLHNVWRFWELMSPCSLFFSRASSLWSSAKTWYSNSSPHCNAVSFVSLFRTRHLVNFCTHHCSVYSFVLPRSLFLSFLSCKRWFSSSRARSCSRLCRTGQNSMHKSFHFIAPLSPLPAVKVQYLIDRSCVQSSTRGHPRNSVAKVSRPKGPLQSTEKSLLSVANGLVPSHSWRVSCHTSGAPAAVQARRLLALSIYRRVHFPQVNCTYTTMVNSFVFIAWCLTFAGRLGAVKGVLVWATPRASAVGRWRLLVATRPGAASGHHMAAHGGSGCAPEDHVPSAAASWRAQRTATACLVANSDQQTGRWRPARSARHRARRNPSHLRRKSACWRSAASRGNGKHLGNTFEREKRLKTKTFTSPDSDVTFPGNKPVSQRSPQLTFQCDFCVSMIRREPTSDCSKEQNTACRGALGTSTRAVACALTSKPQPLLLLHSTGAVASTIKSRNHRRCRRHGQRIKVRSFSNVTVSLICSSICGAGTARIRCTRSTCNVQQIRELVASDVAVSAQQPQSNWMVLRKRQQYTLHGTSSRETTRASAFTPTADPLDSTAKEVTQKKKTLRHDKEGLYCENHKARLSCGRHRRHAPAWCRGWSRVPQICPSGCPPTPTPGASSTSFSRRDRPSVGLVIGHGTKETQHRNVWRVLTAVTKLATVEQHGPRREADRIGHQSHELPRGPPAHAAERQPRADPDVPEEPHVDLLKAAHGGSGRTCHPSSSSQYLAAACSNSHHLENSEQTRPEPKDSWIGTCLNFHYFDIQSWLPRESHGSHLFEFHSLRHLDWKSRYVATFKEIRSCSRRLLARWHSERCA